MKILRVQKVGDFYVALKPPTGRVTELLTVVFDWEVLYGGPFNAGGVDGQDASAIMQAAIDYADIVDAPLFDVDKREAKE